MLFHHRSRPIVTATPSRWSLMSAFGELWTSC
jgi:hypothetical protein